MTIRPVRNAVKTGTTQFGLDVAVAMYTVFGIVVVFLYGCARPSDARTTNATQLFTTVPLRGVVLMDQTSSMRKTWEEPLQTGDVRAAAGPVVERGGDLLVIFIRHDSRVTPAVAFHADPPLPRPVAAGGARDVYEAADAAEQQRRILADWEAKERRRAAGVELELARFIVDVDTQIKLTPDTRGTDLANGLLRAGAFFQEPDVPGQPPSERVLIAVSDGEENAGLTTVTPFSVPVTVLVVNSTGKHGVFAGLSDHPVHFVSVRSAIRYIKGGGR